MDAERPAAETQPAAPRQLELRVETPEGVLRGQLAAPAGAMRLVEFAYGLLELSSAAAEQGARQAAKLGRTVTCRKGCGACCRQLAPLSPIEAAMVAEMVGRIPHVLRH